MSPCYGLPPSEGNIVILTIINRFSEAAHFVPLVKLHTAFETAQVLVSNIFCLHGIPYDIVSDRGPQFVSQVGRTFCNTLAAKVSLKSWHHPQSNGQSERGNQELESTLWCVININPSSWCKHLPWLEYAHSCHTSSATGFSPFEASVGYNPTLLPSEDTEILVPSVQHHSVVAAEFGVRLRGPY